MRKIFDGFDLSQFWEDSDYARKKYVERPLSEDLIAAVEAELGVRLPASYLELMKSQNGGIPRNTCFPTTVPTSWASDHVAITGISGVGSEKIYSLCGALGSKFMQEEWGYPDIGICICDCPSAGHDMIMLDYQKRPEGGTGGCSRRSRSRLRDYVPCQKFRVVHSRPGARERLRYVGRRPQERPKQN
jgi:hypothetical protein